MNIDLTRRAVLRGSLLGVMTALPLPILDIALNGNGTAFAATGAPLPVRFGTWFWALGLVASRWVPAKTGKDFELTTDLEILKPYRDQVNILSGFGLPLDGASATPHDTGIIGIRTGAASIVGAGLPSFEMAIADTISKGARFASIEIACNNNPRTSFTGRSAATPNPSEVDPVALYQRLFGAGFADPNSAAFKPDVNVLLQKSVLSSIADSRKALMQRVGASDRERLDQYFTSLRQAETQLAAQLEKPAPAEACVLLKQAPAKRTPTTLLTDVVGMHKAMVELLALGLACNQTKVFNIALSQQQPTLTSGDEPTGYHQLTHEEKTDPSLNYQPKCEKFVRASIAALGDLLGALSKIKEGDGTLLDRSLIFAHTDSSDAKTHDILGIPMITVGKAGGRIKTGMHIAGAGEPVTRAGLTVQQAMGVPIASWGTKSMQTSKPLSELMA